LTLRPSSRLRGADACSWPNGWVAGDAVAISSTRLAMPRPDDPCFTVLPSGAICGHRYGRHLGMGPCLAGTSSGEASVCACLKFTPKDEADGQPAAD
jgi:hypothetical protein